LQGCWADLAGRHSHSCLPLTVAVGRAGNGSCSQNGACSGNGVCSRATGPVQATWTAPGQSPRGAAAPTAPAWPRRPAGRAAGPARPRPAAPGRGAAGRARGRAGPCPASCSAWPLWRRPPAMRSGTPAGPLPGTRSRCRPQARAWGALSLGLGFSVRATLQSNTAEQYCRAILQSNTTSLSAEKC
jgi:hypothetical protein